MSSTRRNLYLGATLVVGIVVAAVVGAAFYLGIWGSHSRLALDAFNGEYGTVDTRLDTCSTCHSFGRRTNVYGSDLMSAFEAAIKDSSMQLIEGQALEEFVASLHDIEELDSDGDGFSNIDEIAARTFPGDPDDHPLRAP